MPSIPCHVISGFLGSGKTTLIRHLLDHKPAVERWAVLINEFGEAGIDQAMLPDASDIVVQALPGGCLCCQLAVTLKMTLVQLIRRHRPDRVLIEPSGLGHPAGLLEVLQDQDLAPVLDVRAMITLLDPRRLSDSRYLENQTFRDQLAMADALVVSKTDLATPQQLRSADEWLERRWPPLQWVEWVTGGKLPMGRVLGASSRVGDIPSRAVDHPLSDLALAGAPMLTLDMDVMPKPGETRVQRRTALGYHTLGLRWHPAQRFDLQHLSSALEALPEGCRIKAVIHAGQGWRILNNGDGPLKAEGTPWRRDSRIEILWPEDLVLDSEALVARFQTCRTGVIED